MRDFKMRKMRRIAKKEAAKHIVKGALVTRVHHAGNTTNKISRGVYVGESMGRPTLQYDVCGSPELKEYNQRYINDLFNGEVYVTPPEIPEEFRIILDDLLI